MEKNIAIGILITHNRWRKGEDCEPMLKPSDIGEAIDVAITELLKPDKFLTWYHSHPDNKHYVGEQLIKKYKKDTKTK